jgi:hypothetical protein
MAMPEPLVGSGIDVAAAWERACAVGSGHCPTLGARLVPRRQGDGDPLGLVVRHPRPERPMTFAGLPPTGSLQREWRRCGKPRCRCASGMRHGPYWYLRWREGGRQRRRYVPRERVDTTRAALEQRRRLRPPAWSLRQTLAELRQLAKEAHDAGPH